jgi:hypothetical protein
MRNLRLPGLLSAVAVVLVASGAAWYSYGAGLIVGGLLLGLWTALFVLDVAAPAPPKGDGR